MQTGKPSYATVLKYGKAPMRGRGPPRPTAAPTPEGQGRERFAVIFDNNWDLHEGKVRLANKHHTAENEGHQTPPVLSAQTAMLTESAFDLGHQPSTLVSTSRTNIGDGN
ncbi:hypothetical protein EVJ58_g7700 [Rhodofomes roseus]|uniref:Uncharacterized protein n=1 Tax=Rhodofomes roseus TaxID=34475 RepID=A0A4Y9Y1K4_9APHY|nr:hypothetical protein EVJ58_g7700 [Rhodofomes roseus]